MPTDAGPMEGIVGGYTGDSFAVQAVLTTLLACALYNALELLVLVFSIFHSYRSLFFWSLFITTTLGVIPQALGLLLKYLALATIWVPVTLSTIGWCIMVTGHSLVLYSCLHFVVFNKIVLHLILFIIVADIVILQVPQIIVSYGSVSVQNSEFPSVFVIWEKVQVTGFFLQEVLISIIYIVSTLRFLRLHPERSQRKANTMRQLLLINAIFILMDIVVLILQYTSEFMIQTVFKTFFYSVKLKLELAVLSKLGGSVGRQHDNQLSY